jgi:Zn-dependent protease
VNTWWFFVALVPSIILHEVSHGWVANRFGDPTAKEQGRLTLNPISHLDPFGSVVLPALLVFLHLPPFGWARPVPVNVSRLRNPRKNAIWVSLAGPVVNIVLSGAGLAMCWYAYHVNQSEALYLAGIYLGLPNLTLAVFNLLPIPPLDGSALVERFVPTKRLGYYYSLRARALPFLMVLVILDSMTFHILGNLFGDIQNWWLSLIR